MLVLSAPTGSWDALTLRHEPLGACPTWCVIAIRIRAGRPGADGPQRRCTRRERGGPDSAPAACVVSIGEPAFGRASDHGDLSAIAPSRRRWTMDMAVNASTNSSSLTARWSLGSWAVGLR